MSLILAKARKDEMRTLSKCVPVFADAQYAQKREQTLLSLYKYGISGAFILKKLEPLGSMSPQLRKLRMEEQVMERYAEVREYLEGYLPYREDALSVLMEKKEERELSQRKAEAEQLLRQGREASAKGEFERAIAAYKKAIDLMPGEPSAYMESGRVYVRVKMYPQALYRFRQAEEVSKAIPEPNKEIGNVRILQVRERVARGESPTSTEILHLLDEAVQNFSAALAKAESLGPLHGEDGRQRNAEAVSRIAGELLKLNLAGILGKRHPKVRELGMLARDSFTRVAGDDVAELQPDQLLFLGLAALDEGDYRAAEDHFFQAAESRDHFSDACVEINYLGTVLRKRAGAKAAIPVYERLLGLDPPNRAAVNFNVAVAYAVEKRDLDGAAAIVRAVFADPDLPKNEMFYKNTQIYDTLRQVVRLFSKAARMASAALPPQDVVKALHIQDRLERAVTAKDDAEALSPHRAHRRQDARLFRTRARAGQQAHHALRARQGQGADLVVQTGHGQAERNPGPGRGQGKKPRRAQTPHRLHGLPPPGPRIPGTQRGTGQGGGLSGQGHGLPSGIRGSSRMLHGPGPERAHARHCGKPEKRGHGQDRTLLQAVRP